MLKRQKRTTMLFLKLKLCNTVPVLDLDLMPLFSSLLLSLSTLRLLAILAFASLRVSQAFAGTKQTTRFRPHRMTSIHSFPEFLSAPPSLSTTTTHVIGNQAGDADSVVSALALAYIKYWNQQLTTTISTTTASTTTTTTIPHSHSHTQHIPIVSIPRADLLLRPDIILLLQLANIDIQKLIYLDDDYVSAIQPQPQPQLILVDHNRLMHTEWIQKDPTIIEIVDHHYDEGYHQEAIQRTIAFGDTAVASTCTLILEQCRGVPSADLAITLLGVILLDTVNASPTAGKVTTRDQKAMEQLLRQTDWTQLTNTSFLRSGETFDTNKLYNYLSDAKFDPTFWKSLSVKDALRLDYKRFHSKTSIFGISSVLMPITDFMEKDHLMDQLHQYIAFHQLPILLVMSVSMVESTPVRHILLCGNNNDLIKQLHLFLLVNTSLDAQTIDSSATKQDGTNTYTILLAQGNAKASRKQVAPIVMDFFHEKESQ